MGGNKNKEEGESERTSKSIYLRKVKDCYRFYQKVFFPDAHPLSQSPGPN